MDMCAHQLSRGWPTSTWAKRPSPLVALARQGKLTHEEIHRGTFTISSLANFEINFFTAILNPPHTGILSVGRMQEQLYLERER